MATLTNRRAAVIGATLLATGLALGSPASATATRLTAHIVKKIATKVVIQEAPTLSVAHATTAGSADDLGGLPPSAYQDRVAYAAADTAMPLALGLENAVLGPLMIAVPEGVGFLRIDGHVEFSTTNIAFSVYYALDGGCKASGTPFVEGSDGSTDAAPGSASFTAVRAVTPGSHTVTLCTSNNTATATHRSLTVETVAAGSATP
jgi:hypothetical protein